MVIGAMWLGVEMAGALARRGIDVQFIDEGPWLLHELCDPDTAQAAQEALEKRGVTCAWACGLDGFDGVDGRVRAVQTSEGELECDASIVCLHKLPNSALAESIGLKIGTTGGVVVDDHMRTSAPGVWAAGDVVEVPHGLSMLPIRGLTGSHAYAQGRTAGANAAGRGPPVRPGLDPVGVHGRRLHDRRVLDRRDARGGDGLPVRGREGRRRLPRALLPGCGAHARQAAGRARHAEADRRPAARRRGDQGARDFLAFVARRGATLEDIAWMENIYSPPIGALFEPMQIAAQNGLAELPRGRSHGSAADRMRRCASARSTSCGWRRWRTSAAASPRPPCARPRTRGGVFWRFLFVPLYRRVPWRVKQQAMSR